MNGWPFNQQMSEIRATNLKALMDARGWAIGDLIQHCERTTSFWSDRLTGRRNIGEKVARSIEEALGLAHLWLDDDHSAAGRSLLTQEATTAVFQMQSTQMDAILRLAKLLESIPDESRQMAADQLKTLVFAPDSAKARTALAKTLGVLPEAEHSKRHGT